MLSQVDHDVCEIRPGHTPGDFGDFSECRDRVCAKLTALKYHDKMLAIYITTFTSASSSSNPPGWSSSIALQIIQSWRSTRKARGGLKTKKRNE
jgi:hypothetical protein